MELPLTITHRGYPFRLYHEGSVPPATWHLTFCDEHLATFPESPTDDAESVAARCHDWLDANLRLVGRAGDTFQLIRRASAMDRQALRSPEQRLGWLVFHEGRRLTELPLRYLASPDEPEPALDGWLRQHPRRYVGGPLDGARTDHRAERFRPSVPGKILTPDGPLDGVVPAPGEYRLFGDEYRWAPD